MSPSTQLRRASGRRVFGVLLAVATGLSCRDAATAPRRPAAFALAPRFVISPDAPSVPFTKLYAAVYHLPGLELADSQTVDVGTADSVTLNLAVRVVAFTDLFRVVLAGIDANGDTVYRAQADSVRAVAPETPEVKPVVLELTYSGRDTVVHSVQIAPADTQLVVGDTMHYRAVALDATGHAVAGAALRFTSRDPAKIGLTNSGAATALGATTGSWVVVATANGMRDSTRVIVTATPVVQTITDNGPLTFTALHDSAQLVAVAHDRTGQAIAGVPFTYSTPDAAISISATGMVTALQPGTARAVVSSGAVADTVSVTVTQMPASLAVHPDTVTFASLGDSALATFGVLDHNGFTIPGASATWTSRAAGVASVSTAGYVKAVANGQAYVVASSGGLADSLVAVVQQSVASVAATPTSATFSAFGDTVRLTTAITDANGHPVAGTSPSYASTSNAVATVTAQGLITAQGNGSALIVVSSGGKADSVPVTVSQVPSTVTVSSATLGFDALGQTSTLTAVVRDHNGFAIASPSLTWSSSNGGVASVLGGVVTAVDNGTALITAQSGAASDHAAVTVSQVVASLTLSRDTLRLANAGDTATLVATVLDANSHPVTNTTTAWSTADPTIATVDQAGVVTLTGAGVVNVTASAGTKSASTVVIMTPAAVPISVGVAYLRLTPSVDTIFVGDTILEHADFVDASGNATAVSPLWASDNPGRAPIDAAGHLVARDTGTVTITATQNAVTGHATIVILPAPVVTTFSFLPGAVNGITSSTARLSVHIDAFDEGSGISSMQVTFTAPDNTTQSCSAAAPTYGTTRHGGWDCVLTIPAGSATGTWRATQLVLSGSIARTFDEQALATLGATTLTVNP